MNLLSKIETSFDSMVELLRLLLILVMTVYLFGCLLGLVGKIFTIAMEHGAFDFSQMKVILTDSLFTLIVLAIVKSLFIQDSFTYAVTFLEVGFVVLIRKLILLEVDPLDTWLTLVLGVVAALFFVLIIYTRRKYMNTPSPQK